MYIRKHTLSKQINKVFYIYYIALAIGLLLVAAVLVCDPPQPWPLSPGIQRNQCRPSSTTAASHERPAMRIPAFLRGRLSCSTAINNQCNIIDSPKLPKYQ